MAPATPFIVSKGRAWVTFVVKRWSGEKTKEKNKKGGLGCGRLSPYPVGVVSPVAQRCNERWSFGLSSRWCNMLWPCFVLCTSVPSRMGDTGAQIRVDRRGRWYSCRYPRCYRGMDVVVVEWPESCWVRAWFPRSCSLCMVTSVPSPGRVSWWGPPWLPALPEGSTCPSGEAEVCHEGRALPCLRCRGSGEAEIVPDRAQGSDALMTSWGSGETETAARGAYLTRDLSARFGRDGGRLSASSDWHAVFSGSVLPGSLRQDF
jgi:hypothetical protein